MYIEILVLAILLVNLAGLFIRIERPVWAFELSRRVRSALALGTDQPVSFLIRLLIFVLAAVALLIIKNNIISIIIAIAILPFTVLSLLKILNALIPPQTKRHAIVTVLDSYIYEGSGETETRQFALCKVSEPDLGVRILPPCPVNGIGRMQSKSSMSVFFRVGGLGLIYRLPFDEQ